MRAVLGAPLEVRALWLMLTQWQDPIDILRSIHVQKSIYPKVQCAYIQRNNVQCAVSAVQKTVPRPTPVAEVLDLHYTITFKEEQKETFFFTIPTQCVESQ